MQLHHSILSLYQRMYRQPHTYFAIHRHSHSVPSFQSSSVPPVGLLQVRRQPVRRPDRVRVLRAVPAARGERRDGGRVFREALRERRGSHLHHGPNRAVQHGLELPSGVTCVVTHVIHTVRFSPRDLDRGGLGAFFWGGKEGRWVGLSVVS